MDKDQIIDRKYRIKGALVEGSLSTVFLAEDLGERRDVALKLLNPEVSSSYVEDFVRFKREVEAVGRIHHPGIVTVKDAGQYENALYIVTELPEGRYLSEVLRDAGLLGIDTSVEIVRQVAEILSHVHARDVVHGDLKPGNIVVSLEDDTCRVRLFDFGLSHLMELNKIRDEEEILGTFGYMSPEATGILKKPVDERSDIYSLGIVFYELVTGRRPYDGRDTSTLIYQHIAQEPPLLRELNASIPPVIERIILRLMAKDPFERYQSVSGLLADLEEYLRQRRDGTEVPDFEIARSDRLKELSFVTRLVGREKELGILREAITRSLESKGSFSLVHGDPGAGKTRLIDEVRGHVHSVGGTFVRGGGSRSDARIPFEVFSEALRAYVRWLKRAGRKEQESAVKRMREAFGELGGEVVKIVPEIVELIGEPPELVEMEAEKARIRFLITVTDFILSLGAPQRPLVLFLDDLQWADEGSIELLERIGEKVGDHPIAVLVSFRDKEVDGNHPLMHAIGKLRERNLPVHDVPVGPFELGDTARMISEILLEDEATVLPLARELQERTKGNPFFIQELLHSLVDEEIVYFEDNHYRCDLARLAKAALPTNVVEAVIKRMADVCEETQKILSCGSVMGRDIELGLLSRLSSLPQERVLDAVEDGVQNQFLIRDMTSQENICFAHERIREAFYHKVPEDERRALHQGVGVFLEQQHQENLDPVIHELAHHFSRAGIEEKALLYALRAGKKAQAAFAHDQAIRLYDQARVILERQGKTSEKEYTETLEKLGEACYQAGRYDAALEILRTCESLIPKGDKLRRAGVLSKLGDTLQKKGELRNCEEVLVEALKTLGVRLPGNTVTVGLGILNQLLVNGIHSLFRGILVREKYTGDPYAEVIAHLLYRLFYLYYFTDLVKSIYVLFRGQNIAEKSLGPSRKLSQIYGAAAFAWSQFGWPWWARRVGRLSEEIAEKLNDKASVGLANAFLAWVEHPHQPSESVRPGSKAAEILKGVGEYWDWTHAASSVLWSKQKMGENISALLEENESHVAIVRSINAAQNLGWVLGIRGFLLSLVADERLKGEGIETLEESIRLLEEVNDKPWIICAVGYLAHAHLRLGNYGEAIRQADRVGKLFLSYHNLTTWLLDIVGMCAEVYLHTLVNKPDLSEDEKARCLKSARHFCMLARFKGWQYPTYRGWAYQVNGTYQWLTGQREKAVRTWGKGIAYLREHTQDSYRLACTLLEAGSFLIRDTPRDKRAQEYLIEAKEIFIQLGAKGDVETVRGFLATTDEALRLETPQEKLQSERRMATVLHTSRDLSSILNLDELLERILDSTMELVGAERGVLMLYGLEGQDGQDELAVKVVRNVKAEDVESLDYCRSIISRAVEQQKSLLIHDATSDTESRDQASGGISGVRSVLCAPMITKGRVLGAIYLDNHLVRGLFNDRDLEVLELISSQAAVSVENARLYNNVIRNERALMESEEKYRLISENASDLIAVTSLGGVYTYVSPSHRQYGYEPEELLGRHVVDLMHPGDREAIEKLMEEYSRVEAVKSEGNNLESVAKEVEFRFCTQSGEWPYFGSTLNLVLDRSGDPVSFLLVSRDITRRKQAEEESRVQQEQLFQAAKLASLGTLVSGVAHEINNPLSYVMLNAPMIEKFWDGIKPILDDYYREKGDFSVANMNYAELCEEIPALLADIVDGTKRVKNIVNDLREFARKTPPELTDEVDIDVVTKQAVGLVWNLIKNSTRHFSVTHGSGIPTFKGSIQRIEQVIINLVVNACQALTDKEQAVLVATRYAGDVDSVVVEVRDEGGGIPADVLARIKDPFYTTKRESGGTGLGLAITDRIVQAHGGTMEFASTPGQGTTVTVRFPVHSERGTAGERGTE